MRKGMAAIAACVFIVAGTARVSRAATNLLVNPDFEPPAAPNAGAGDVSTTTAGSPWAGWNTWVPPYGAFYSSTAFTDNNHAFTAHSGTQVGKSYGSNAGLMQFLPASEGQTYTGSGYLLKASNDPWTDPFLSQTAEVQIVFWNVPPATAASNTGDRIGTFTSGSVLTNATPDNEWHQGTVTGTAPTGTQAVQFLFFYNNPLSAGGAFFADDASLTLQTNALPGDVNNDGLVNGQDINPFVYALLNGQSAFATQYPTGSFTNADVNADTLVNGQDINPFVSKLLGTGVSPAEMSALSAVPEPGVAAVLAGAVLALRRRRSL